MYSKMADLSIFLVGQDCGSNSSVCNVALSEGIIECVTYRTHRTQHSRLLHRLPESHGGIVGFVSG